MDTTRENTIRKRGPKPGFRGRKPSERVRLLFNPSPKWRLKEGDKTPSEPTGRELGPVRVSALRDVSDDDCPKKAAVIDAILKRRIGGAR